MILFMWNATGALKLCALRVDNRAIRKFRLHVVCVEKE